MKKHYRILTVILGLIWGSAPAVWADGSADTSGNQLMKNSTHWYQKAAETVGPVEGVKTDTGTLLTLQSGSYLYMEGDSTLHKYQMNAKALMGSAVVKTKSADHLLQAIQAGEVGNMTLVVPLKTFNSKDKGLDNNAYKALNATAYPEITFNLTRETLAAGSTADSYVMTAIGTVTAAGVSAPVTLMADASFQDGQVRLKGVQALKMTDFKVTPPTMSILIVSVTCTDAINIYYDVTFAAK
jgi:polyisoprenoid-binding protein YceI